jgi:hypothetical protein
MVSIDDKLAQIKSLIDENYYMNRPSRFGESTTLALLGQVLKPLDI